jgi:hypothetical protein
MHQNTAVVEIEIDEEIAVILNIGNIFAPEHIPVGISFKDGRPYRSDLNDWWHRRSIPASRQNFREAMEDMGITSAGKLLTKCFGLSLSDQYWVNPTANPLDWEKINFFDNSFSEDVGNVLFGKKPQEKQLNLASPDNTSDGWLKKKWKIIDGKRCLIKGGSNPFQQEPLNEVCAAVIMRRLDINCIPYTIHLEDGLPYSVCENFITRDTELISAYYIHNTQKIKSIEMLYEHFLDCCFEIGIPNARENLDKMLTLDYLIANRDRHLSNFGAIRNAKTLKWLGIAPIFDSGTSLWNDMLSADFNTNNTKSRPFFDTHEEQIKLVKDFSWLDLSKLNDIDEEISEVFTDSPFIDEARRTALCNAVKKRVKMLKDITNL